MTDFTKFDTAAPDLEGRVFERLGAGTYVMRVVGYNRSKTRKGDDALIFKLIVLQGLTPESSSKGDCLWFVNLVDSGVGFIREAVLAVCPDGWTGDLTNDDSVKSTFLGKVIKTQITMEFRNGKSYPSVGRVASFSSDDHPSGSPEQYWNVAAMRSHASAAPPSPEPDQGNGSPPAAAGKSSAFDDDDIPF